LEKKKTKIVESMSIVGMALESKRVEMVKLKIQKEELMAKLGQMKPVLDFMQSIVAAKRKLEKVLTVEDHVDHDQEKLQRMTCEFYRSIMN
jgi:hypothetical protein